MQTDSSLVLGELVSLDLWRSQLRRHPWSRNLPAVQFQFRAFSDEQNKTYSALANALQRECGCAVGGSFMSVTVVAVTVLYFMSGKGFSNITLLKFLALTAIAVAATLGGKVFSLSWARWRLLRLSARARNEVVRASQPAVAESI